MWSSCRQVWVAFATKDTQMIIGRRLAKKGEVWGGFLQHLCGQNVDEVGGCLQRLNPKGRREGCLEQKGTHNIVDGTNDALSLTVLGRGVEAGHAEVNTVGEEERAGGGVVKLPAVVALDGLHGHAKLSVHVGKEMSERRESVRFQLQRKSSQVM